MLLSQSNLTKRRLIKHNFFISAYARIIKIICFVIFLNCVDTCLFAQTSDNKGMARIIHIPAMNNGNGPVEVILDLEYQFWRETFDGKTYYLGISYKTIGMDWNQNKGFRMNDKIYMPNILMAADSRGYHGFEQIKVSGLSIEFQVQGTDKSFVYNNNYYSRARIAEINKSDDINKYSLDILFATVKSVNWQNDQELRARVTAIDNNKQKENSSQNSTNQTSNNNNQSSPKSGLPIENSKNTFNNTQNSTNQSTNNNNQSSTKSGMPIENSKNTFNNTQNSTNQSTNNNTFNSNQPSVNSVNNPYNSTNKSSAPSNNDPLNGLADKMKNQQLQNDQIFKNIDNSFTKLANDQRVMGSYNESISNNKKRLEEASQLSGNYSSIADIEREFSNKMSSIRGITNNIESQQNAKLNYAVGAKFNANPTEMAIGQGLNLVGNILNGAKAARDAREAQEQLRIQRENEIKKFEEERKRAILEMRQDLFKRFPDGSPPKQSKYENNTIYFFAYITEKNKIQETKPLVTVTNIFPVSKFDDGTFPYKVSIMNKLTGIAPGNINLTGFFESSERAEEIRKVFIKLAETSQLTVKQFQLKTNSTSASNTNKTIASDFWENGKNTDSSQLKKQIKKDAFWEN